LPYASSALSVLALLVLTPTITGPPMKSVFSQGSDLVLIGIQLLITILLFVTGLKNNKDSFPGKAILLFSVIVLFVLCVGAIYISTWEFEEIAKGFTNIMIRVYAGVNLVVVALALYACK
jgi:phosphoglycerol transferase MdoB-like AlkP superfamily enzyme